VGGKSFWARAEERGLPRAAAQATAHGLRAGWDWVTHVGKHAEPTPQEPAHSPKHVSRAMAAAKATSHRASREGIVAQPPKEHLDSSDRASLDKLLKP
jgi:hypothetical protein